MGAALRDRAPVLRFYTAPMDAVGPLWPLVDHHLHRACERGVGDISTDTLRADREDRRPLVSLVKDL